MADLAPKDFSTTAASNPTVGGVNIAEGSQAAQLNNALRAVMAVIANPDFGVGTLFKVDTIAESTADAGVTIDGVLIKDGAIPSISALIDTTAIFRTGDYRETSRSTADTGWLMANGDTLGSAASAADQASDDNEDLFLHLWNSFANAQLPVTGGRGASAAADWAANKVIALPDRRNNMPIGAGNTYVNGETGGEAAVTLTAEQSGLPSHVHNIRVPNTTYDNNVGSTVNRSTGTATTSSTVNVTGSNVMTATSADASQAHNNLPPYMGVYYQIKL